MVRRVGLGAACALLTLGFSVVSASAQTFIETQGDFAAWSEARRAKALDAINRADLSKQEIASILPLLRDLERSEQIRRADLAQLENDLLFAKKGDIIVDSRIATINAAHRERVSKIWMTITERIGATKAATLRSLVDDTVIDQSAYYRSERISRIDQIIIDWDKATSDRIAMHERHNAMVREQIAANERLLQQQAVVTVTPVPEQPVIAETVVQTQSVQTTVRPVQPAARFHRSAPAKQPVKRAKRVKGLG